MQLIISLLVETLIKAGIHMNISMFIVICQRRIMFFAKCIIASIVELWSFLGKASVFVAGKGRSIYVSRIYLTNFVYCSRVRQTRMPCILGTTSDISTHTLHLQVLEQVLTDIWPHQQVYIHDWSYYIDHIFFILLYNVANIYYLHRNWGFCFQSPWSDLP